MNQSQNIDPAEVQRFAALSNQWWDDEGPMKSLHAINPVRLKYILQGLCEHFGLNSSKKFPLEGISIIDVGCGAGLLCEPLARLGALVTGIDATKENISAANHHSRKMGLSIKYQNEIVENMAGKTWDVVLAMEVVEHVPDKDLFIAQTLDLVRKKGIFIGSTINRTIPSLLLAVGAAEYILGWVPKGTHNWGKFVKPSEFGSSLRNAQFDVTDIKGVSLNLSTGVWTETDDTRINYMIQAKRD